MTKIRFIIVALSLITLSLIAVAYFNASVESDRLVASIPAAPEIVVPEFTVPELPLTGIEVIDRAIEFGPASEAVKAALQEEFYRELERSGGDQNAAIFALIDSVQAVDSVIDKIRLAEIEHLQNAVDVIRDDVQRYRDSVATQVATQSGLSLVALLALAFAGIQSVAAVVALFIGKGSGD